MWIGDGAEDGIRLVYETAERLQVLWCSGHDAHGITYQALAVRDGAVFEF